MSNPFVDYFRCPEHFAAFEPAGELSREEGYFRFGDAICYGRCAAVRPAAAATGAIEDVSGAAASTDGRLRLPFGFQEVVDNLRHERYSEASIRGATRLSERASARRAYYRIRPMLPVVVRKHLQRIGLNGWKKIPFPAWPVDCTVDVLMANTMKAILRTREIDRIPFIWFWPNGASGCAVMTHDVEGPAGVGLCSDLIDLDDSLGVKSAFHVIPEGRYALPKCFIAGVRARGCEVNVHDLNHDGRLYESRDGFMARVARINGYGRRFQSVGFRAGSMYRNQRWFDALEFAYDMSVPSVAHLEAQSGGCCTVMPYFVGNLLELPLTTTQDYSLFHVLGQYSVDLWSRQIELILERNGLITFITHPDYLTSRRARDVYRRILDHLTELRDLMGVWLTLPGEVNRWWRARHQLRLVQSGTGWSIEGEGSARATLAYATLDRDRLVFSVPQ